MHPPQQGGFVPPELAPQLPPVADIRPIPSLTVGRTTQEARNVESITGIRPGRRGHRNRFRSNLFDTIFVGLADDDLDEARGVIHNMARYEWGRGPVRIATGTWADILEYRLEPGEVAVAYPALGVPTPGCVPPGIRVVRNRQLHTVLTANAPSEVTRWLALGAGDDFATLTALLYGLDAAQETQARLVLPSATTLVDPWCISVPVGGNNLET